MSAKLSSQAPTSGSTVLCREAELATLLGFCARAAEGGAAGSMYLSGSPGLGKTMVVRAVQETIAGWAREGGRRRGARAVHVNAMGLRDGAEVFKKLFEALFPTTRVPARAVVEAELGERLRAQWKGGRKAAATVLFVDEIDMLLSGDDSTILDSLFEIPTWANATLSVVGIANTIDLTERVLPALRQRGCTPEHLNFHAYNTEQLVQILTQRLAADPAAGGSSAAEAGGTGAAGAGGAVEVGAGLDDVSVESSAIEFCARKVAAQSGDARKALGICHRAATLATRERRAQEAGGSGAAGGGVTVDVTHVAKAAEEQFGSRVVGTIQGLPQHQKIAVCAASVLVRRSQTQKFALSTLYSEYRRICSSAGGPAALSQSEFVELCDSSLQHHLILDLLQAAPPRKKRAMGKASNKGGRQATLQVREEDIQAALGGNRIYKGFLELT